MKRALLTFFFTTSCFLITGYELPPEEGVQCTDGLDNDTDGAPDCADDSCAAETDCAELGHCDDTIDNDQDGDFDCDDSDCALDDACTETGECTDTIDNDDDGDTDCADADCSADPFCNTANQTPITVDDLFTINEDSILTKTSSQLILNDSDPDGDPLTVTAVNNPSTGTVSLVAGDVVFTPAANFNGPASFDYTVSDGNGGTATGQVIVTIDSVNDEPTAADDNKNTPEDTDLTLRISDLDGNDTDLDLDALSLFSVQNALNGSASLSVGVITFTPALNFNGLTAFEYTESDGNGGFATAKVFVNVAAVNDPPSAGSDVFSTSEDVPVDISTSTLLQNDTDVEQSPITFVSFQNVQGGSISQNGSTLTFTPTLDFNGSASFEYTITDGTDSSDGTVIVAVGVAGDPPVANPDSVATNEDTPLLIDVDDLLLNDLDIDGDLLIITSVQNAAGGAASLAGGTITFTPALNFNGPASFEYTVTDGFFPVTGLVSVDVAAVNDAPSADTISVSTAEDTPLVITLSGVDVDGDSLQFIKQNDPTKGTLGAINIIDATTSQVTYTPNPNATGPDSFDFVSFDGAVTSTLATTNITINNANDDPTAGDNADSTNEDIPLPIDTADLLANDSDPDLDLLFVQSVQNAINGSVSLSGAIITFTPNANFNGSASFEYTVSDGAGGLDTALVNITVSSINDEPTFNQPINLSINEDTPTNITIAGITAGPADEAAQSITILAFSNNTAIIPNPTASPVSGGSSTLTLAPSLHASGTVTISVTATDNGGTANGGDNSSLLPFQLVVTAVADQPNLTANNTSGNEDTNVPVSISSSLVDTDGSESLSIVVGGVPAGVSFSAGTLNGSNLTVTQAQLGGLTLTPSANFNGPIDLTVSATATESSNGDFASVLVGFTVNVLPVNDGPTAFDDSFATNEDTPIGLSNAQLVANDTDIDSTLTVIAANNAVNGSVSLVGGVATFTPNSNFSGTGSFEYTVSDGSLVDIGLVTVTVNAVNDAPVAGDNSASTEQEIPVDITTATLLTNDTDVDSGTLTVISVQTFVGGSASLAGTIVTFTPAAGFIGSASFEYTVSDGSLTDIGLVTVNVTPAICGNGIRQTTEQCDDGNTTSGDGCSAVCTSEQLALNNGSFESGDYAGWTLLENSGIPDFGVFGNGTNGQLIQNGQAFFDFHDGIDVAWTGCGVAPFTVIATNGNRAAFQVQNGPENHRMFQDITVPASASLLSWDMFYRNDNGNFDVNSQFIALNIRDPSTDAIVATPFKTVPGSPIEVPMTNFVVDMAPFAGQTIRIDVELQVQIFCFDAVFDDFFLQ